MSDNTKRYSDRMVRAWFEQEHPDRQWMATANRQLSFRRINRELRDMPPSVILRTGYRVFLFKSGNDRGQFVQAFHKGFEAKAYHGANT